MRGIETFAESLYCDFVLILIIRKIDRIKINKAIKLYILLYTDCLW